MAELVRGGIPPTDADLIAASRSGDTDAYASLYARHAAAARTLARQLVRGRDEADDLVAEAFARVFDALRRGAGPSAAFRPYLLTVVRRTAYDRHRSARRQVVTDEPEVFDPGEPFVDPAVADLDRSMVARAFRSLPERWRLVLWHTEVEGAKAADVAPLLGLTAAGVAALAYRAREGLRQAYLQMHLSGVVRQECRPIVAKLGGYVRGGLASRDSATIAAHLDDCADCRAVYAELVDVNATLRTVVAPIVLGPAAAGYLAATSASGVRAAVGARLAGRARWLRGSAKARQVAVAGGVVAAVAALVAVALALTAARSHVPRHVASGSVPSTPPTSSSRREASSPAVTGHVPRRSSVSARPLAAGSAVRSAMGSPTSRSTGSVARPKPATGPIPAAPTTTLLPRPGGTRAPQVSPSTGPSRTSPPAPRLIVQIGLGIGLVRGTDGHVMVVVTDTGRTVTGKLTVTIDLPPHVVPVGPSDDPLGGIGASGWSCTTAAHGAVCMRGPLGPGQTSIVDLAVRVAADAPIGATPLATVESGRTRVTVRALVGVIAP